MPVLNVSLKTHTGARTRVHINTGTDRDVCCVHDTYRMVKTYSISRVLPVLPIIDLLPQMCLTIVYLVADLLKENDLKVRHPRGPGNLCRRKTRVIR